MKNQPTLELKELKIIDQVLVVPLYASGPDKLLKATELALSYIKSLHDKINETIKKIENEEIEIPDFSPSEFESLVKVYVESVSLAKEFDDIQTLTGYSEEEVDALVDKLKNNLVG